MVYDVGSTFQYEHGTNLPFLNGKATFYAKSRDERKNIDISISYVGDKKVVTHMNYNTGRKTTTFFDQNGSVVSKWEAIYVPRDRNKRNHTGLWDIKEHGKKVQ